MLQFGVEETASGVGGNMFSRLRIQFKITVLLIALLVLAVALNIIWSDYTQVRQAEKEMLEKTQILNQEMRAVWEFIDINQGRIDTDANGNYNFKNIYCAIAGKSVAALFMRDTDYTVKYVSLEPRRSNSRPDAFEREALEFFALSGEDDEIYQITTYEDREVFRYTTPIFIKESCLSCHGDPKGEIDITGHAKEGLQNGDIAGAVSIIMPIDLYMTGIQQNILQQSLYFFVVIALLITVVYLAISLLVTRPLRRVESAIEQIESGNLNIDLNGSKSSGEIKVLEQKFSSMAQRLQSSYDNLEKQVDDRTRQLANANRILEQQRIGLKEANDLLQSESQYKSDFLAIMSHELRTPLTSILAFAEICEESDETLSEKDKTAIREIKENGYVLLHMVNNILEVARIDAGKTELTCEWVDMVDLLSTVETSIQPLANKRQIRFETQVSPGTPLIYADWEKLRRILENLVSNAVKFTQRGGSARVEVCFVARDTTARSPAACDPATRDSADQDPLSRDLLSRDPAARARDSEKVPAEQPRLGEIQIRVSDTGIGIEEHNIPKVFEKFTQLDKSSHRRYSGSGLGLAVVRELTEAMGGFVEVESAFKKGSTFTVHIPIDEKEWDNNEDTAG
jgi:signal transduction histidine kinase